MVPLNYGAPKAATALAEQARRIAGTQPTAAAVLAAAVAARAYALNHQSEQARDALTAADALMNRLPDSEQSDTWLTYSEQKHFVHVSHAYTTLADTRRARESQQRALELSKPTSTMTRTLLNIDRELARGGLVLVALGMGCHLMAGTLNQAALAREQAGAAAAAWLLSAQAAGARPTQLPAARLAPPGPVRVAPCRGIPQSRSHAPSSSG